MDPCAKQETEDLGASSLFDLSKVYYSPRQFYFIFYSSDVTELNEKLKEKTHQREKEKEAKATLEKELTALCR